ncbi:hypothetical protein GM415_07320 [Pseudodesulfovibrio cashew]|uniref:Uncharacterized protein n=1 Tax=Pseudodesulfovibrio cashew TaxID=2678688 RepID=A0A6I6JI21_9BACT|nr:hypothetical protein [Pseudodesulfovibrio cashew]QGY39942.1 hypothetical protein GM415_07320 [Pseudodesulfovibrio cashew]
MNYVLSPPDILFKTFARLRRGSGAFARIVAAIFGIHLLAGLARGLFPGLYTFNPFDLGWLLIPEAMALGPLLALLCHRILDTGDAFGWSGENRLVKLGKAAAYCYVLFVSFMLGTFVVVTLVPTLFGQVVGPAAGRFQPLIVAAGAFLLLPVYVRAILVYPVLSGDEAEPLMRSLALTKGYGRQMASCLLLLASPVLIPWVAASAYAGDWLNPSLGPGLRLMPIITRSMLLTLGALLLSTGLCVIYEALIAEEARAERARKQGDTDLDV